MNLAKSSQDFEDLTTAEIVAWALENYNPRIGVACSFQAESACRLLVVGKSGY
jgi:3'-phosphoadenosine 5'-phosphosulfate sulfotransferase (PAPS reductase)/FAD synthetase